MKLRALLILLTMFVTVASADTVPPRRTGRPFKHHELLRPVYPWRMPAKGGELKLLILSHSWVTAEFAEFCKRFDFAYDLVPIWSENLLGRGHRSESSRALWDRITRLLDENDYDAILVTGYGNFPIFVWASIYRECMEGGAGLLIFNPRNPWCRMTRQIAADKFITKDDHLKEVPISAVAWTGCYDEDVETDPETQRILGFKVEAVPLRTPDVIFATHGDKCRYVQFGWEKGRYSYWSTHHGPTPAGLSFPFARIYPMADHIFAIAGKAVVWSAGRLSPVRFAKITPSEQTVTPKQRGGVYEAILLNETERLATVTIDWEVVDEGGRRLASGRKGLTVPAGSTGVGAKLGAVPVSGRDLYFRARLLEGEKVIDWATSHLAVEYPKTLGLAVTDQTLHAADRPLAVRLSVAQPDADEELRVDLIDSWNRMVRSVVCPADAKQKQVWLSLEGALGAAFRIRARRMSSGAVVDQQETFCTLRRPPTHRYWAIRSTSATSTVTGWYLTNLNRLYGINFYRDRSRPLFANMHVGLQFGVYSYYGRITGPIPPDMSERYDGFIKKDVLPVKAFGASLFDFGDDTGVGIGLFRSKAKKKEEKQAEEAADWARFTDYLKTVYDTPAELAASWAVPIKSWDDASRKHVMEEQKKENMVPLLDYRRYQEHLYAQHLGHMRKILKRELPWAQTTLNAWGRIGRDMPALAKQIDGMVPYYRPYTLRMVRGILGRDKTLGYVTGDYYGSKTNKRFLSFIPWEGVLLGGNVTWIWGAGCITGDGAFKDTTYPIFESTRELSSGIGELLATAEWDNGGVYVLYSPASNHAQEMGTRLGMTMNSSETFCALLEELQLGYDYIASESVAAGALQKRRARVLFLPYSVALEPAVQEQVRKFVQGGGIVIADFRPATHTPRGRPVGKGGLDDLFGVRYRKADKVVGHGLLPGTQLQTMVDLSTIAAGADAGGQVGDGAVLLTNKTGRGRTLLFNCFLGRYRTLLSGGRAGEFTQWLAEALTGAGVGVRPMGTQPAGTRIFSYLRGPIRYLAVYRDDIAGVPERVVLNLKLPGPFYVYDVRNGGYLGRLETLELDTGKQEPHVLALSPEALPMMTVRTMTPHVRPGEAAVLRVDCGRGRPERMIRLDVRDPDGNRYPITGRLFWTERGRRDFRWATAVDDAPGLYRLTLTDIDTGQRWQTAIRVAGEPLLQVLGKKGGAR